MTLYQDKERMEKQAKLIVEKLFPELGIFEVKDKPDLQNFINDVGIEITQAVDSNLFIIASNVAKGRINDTDLHHTNISYTETGVNELSKMLKDKYEKLNRFEADGKRLYADFKAQGVYFILNISKDAANINFITNILKEILTDIKKENYKYKFDFIILVVPMGQNNTDKIFKINLNNLEDYIEKEYLETTEDVLIIER